MLLGVTVGKIVAELNNDRETDLREMKTLLRAHGAFIGDERKPVRDKSELPRTCLLSLETPRCWHWSLFHDGIFYDPEHGVMTDFPAANRKYYWEVRIPEL